MAEIRVTVLSCILMSSWGGSVLAHSPVDFLEVFAAEPARAIQHDVELKSKLDDEKHVTYFQGPEFFARSVGCMDQAAKTKPTFLNWFRIVDPPQELTSSTPRREEPICQVSVLDMVRGSSSKLLSVQQPEYLISPSQLITTGVPDPVPSGVDHYKAYRVVDAPSLNRQVKLTGSLGTSIRKLGRPLFVCMPVDQWHHDQHVSITHPDDCFVVYELDEQNHQQKFSTMDQFGLNELKTKTNRWLCVRAVLLKTISD